MKHVKELVEKWAAIAASKDVHISDALLIFGCANELRAAIAEDEKISTCTTNIDE